MQSLTRRGGAVPPNSAQLVTTRPLRLCAHLPPSPGAQGRSTGAGATTNTTTTTVMQFTTPSHFPGQAWSSAPRTIAGPDYARPGAQDSFAEGVQHTQQPIVTGTSVLGIKYKDGVLLAADTLASYGSLARFMDIRRIVSVGANTILGASGDMSDFQATQTMLEKLMYVPDPCARACCVCVCVCVRSESGSS